MSLPARRKSKCVSRTASGFVTKKRAVHSGSPSGFLFTNNFFLLPFPDFDNNLSDIISISSTAASNISNSQIQPLINKSFQRRFIPSFLPAFRNSRRDSSWSKTVDSDSNQLSLNCIIEARTSDTSEVAAINNGPPIILTRKGQPGLDVRELLDEFHQRFGFYLARNSLQSDEVNSGVNEGLDTRSVPFF
ncbi:Protein of unknown function [Cotesia congregata]|uniref:Uncharacterized protein n=1 Tax=Cotesia congregata TaxID=51543 RepID=A0A8J2EE15_COTCN|nr:Protein of unknown function [Cotesia congregata]